MRALPRTALTLGLFLAVSLCWSWPLARDPAGLMVSLQFDHYGVHWVQNAAPHLRGLVSEAASWPLGQPLHRLDSVLLVPLAWLCHHLLGAANLAGGLLVLLGPVLSAWAAERFAARTLGAAFPWSLLAGLVYGFGGLMATALLDGHVYMMLVPWLPLLAGAAFRAGEAAGTAGQGALAGLWWVLALFTSAYIGIAASVLLAGIGVAALQARSLRPRAVAGLLAVVLPVGLAYAALFAAGGLGLRGLTVETGAAPGRIMAVGGTRITTLIAAIPSIDLRYHSVAPVLGFTGLCLAVVAPWVLGRSDPARRPARVLLLLAGACLLLSLGPTVQLLDNRTELGPALLAPFVGLGITSYFRFPVRLLWVSLLGIGAVAAVVATRLAAVAPRRAAWLLPFAAAEALLLSAVPFRAGAEPLAAPSAYAAAPAGRAVLDLFPRFLGTRGDLDLLTNNLSCMYASQHGRPVLSACLGVAPDAMPRQVLGTAVLSTLLDRPRADDLPPRLAALGVGAVVLHPDLFLPGDRAVLQERLERVFGPPIAESTDGGEAIAVYGVPGAPVTRAEAAAAWQAAHTPDGTLAPW